MARPDTNHEEKKAQIIEAALRTFAEYGYEGTTNKLIAEEVKRSTGQSFTPALIYHYFPEGKLQLFTAVMKQYEPLQAVSHSILEDMEAPPEVFLKRVARAYLQIFNNPNALGIMRLLITEGPRHPEIAQQMVANIAPLFIFPLGAYLMQQAELGRLRPVTMPTTIVEFYGPLFAGKMLGNILKDASPFPFPTDEELVETHVQTFLHGLSREAASQERK